MKHVFVHDPKDELINKINSISDPWIIDQICRFVDNITK